jgi:hypothetical protein
MRLLLKKASQDRSVIAAYIKRRRKLSAKAERNLENAMLRIARSGNRFAWKPVVLLISVILILTAPTFVFGVDEGTGSVSGSAAFDIANADSGTSTTAIITWSRSAEPPMHIIEHSGLSHNDYYWIEREGAVKVLPASKALSWNWDDVAGINTSVTAISEVWDGIRNPHYSNVYIDNNTKREDTATWWDISKVYTDGSGALYNSHYEFISRLTGEEKTGAGMSVRRFKGTFTIPDGYTVADNIQLKSSRSYGQGDVIPINDNIFVLIYPEDVTPDNDPQSPNYFINYLAFWTGTIGGEGEAAAGFTTFGGMTKTPTTRNAGISEMSHTNGWYCGASQDNIGVSMLQSDPEYYDSPGLKKTGWIVDLFAMDYSGGGGMDRLNLDFRKNATQNTLTVKYYKDTFDEENNIGSYVIGKNYATDSAVTIGEGTAPGQLNYMKTDEKLGAASLYEDGEQDIYAPQSITEGSNIVKVLYKLDKEQSYRVNGAYENEEGINIADATTLTLNADNRFTGTVSAPKITGYILVSHSIDGGENVTAAPGAATFTLATTDHAIVFRYIKDIFIQIDDEMGEDPPDDGSDPIVGSNGPGSSGGSGVTATGGSTGSGNSGSGSSTGSSGSSGSSGGSGSGSTPGRGSGGSTTYAQDDDTRDDTSGGDTKVITPVVPPLDPKPDPNTKSVPDNDPPINPGGIDHWALFNLFLTGTAAVITFIILLGWLTRRNEDEENHLLTNLYRILSLVTTILGITIFMLTENMSLPMTATDEFTIYALVIVIAQFLLAYLTRKKYNYEQDELDI